MKKFKVIEKSRFLNYDTMSNVKGGLTQCGIGNLYDNLCTTGIHVTCGTALAMPTYFSDCLGHESCTLYVRKCANGLLWSKTCTGIPHNYVSRLQP